MEQLLLVVMVELVFLTPLLEQQLTMQVVVAVELMAVSL